MKAIIEGNNNITVNIDPRFHGDFSPITGTIRMTKGFAKALHKELDRVLRANTSEPETLSHKEVVEEVLAKEEKKPAKNKGKGGK